MQRPPDRAHAILAHYFHGPDGSAFPPAQGSVSLDEWEAGLDAYGSRLIPAKEWIARCLAGQQRDEVCVTFDDGLREAYVLALPALRKRGLTAAWNVYTGPYVGVPNNLERWRWLRNHGFGGMEGFYAALDDEIGLPPHPEGYLADVLYLSARDRDFRYWRDVVCSPLGYERVMEWLMRRSGRDWREHDVWIHPEELRDLWIDGPVIGIHTHSHPTDIRTLSREGQALEYATARSVLAHAIYVSESTIRTVSHPCGRYTGDGIAWIRQHGFDLAWGARMDGAAPWLTPRWSTGHWRL